MACKEGQSDVVKLINFKAFSINLNAQHVNGMTGFHMACKEGQFDVVELMVNDQFL